MIKPLNNSATTTRVDVHGNGKTSKVSTKGAEINNEKENVGDQNESSRIKEADDPSENGNFVKKKADTEEKNPAMSGKVENQDGSSGFKDGENSSKRVKYEGTPPISRRSKENKSMSRHCENGQDKRPQKKEHEREIPTHYDSSLASENADNQLKTPNCLSEGKHGSEEEDVSKGLAIKKQDNETTLRSIIAGDGENVQKVKNEETISCNTAANEKDNSVAL